MRAVKHSWHSNQGVPHATTGKKAKADRLTKKGDYHGAAD